MAFCFRGFFSKFNFMKIEDLHHHFLNSKGICTDTRNITKGCLFFALKGENFNGNKFAQEALDKGALKVVIDEIGYHKNTGETILCSSGLRMLQKLANFHRKYLKLPIISITGSNGKTTTKEFIHAVLSQKYNTVATKGNLNNHIGVPLTLLTMNSSTEMGIVEMGANHPKEIEELCNIALPDYGYITNFGKAHLEGFGSLEGVIRSKTELYEHLDKIDKLVFVNGNDDTQMLHSSKLKRVTFGNTEQDYNIHLKDASKELILAFEGEIIKSNLIGLYNFHNIAAAIAIGAHFKVSAKDIKTAIENYTPTNNRSQIIEKGTNTIFLDAYNANPTSMIAALENFSQLEADQKVLFLGDMFELGTAAESEHQNIVDFLETNEIGSSFLIGANFFKMRVRSSQIQKFETFEDLKDALQNDIPKNSQILIKGSRGMALERIVDLL